MFKGIVSRDGYFLERLKNLNQYFFVYGLMVSISFKELTVVIRYLILKWLLALLLSSINSLTNSTSPSSNPLQRL